MDSSMAFDAGLPKHIQWNCDGNQFKTQNMRRTSKKGAREKQISLYAQSLNLNDITMCHFVRDV